MATSRADILEALKYTYGVDRVLYLFNEEVVLWNIIGRQKKPVGGRGQFIMPITVQNPGSWKGAVEGGPIATALAPDTTEATFALTEFNGTYDITWKLIQDARNSKFAFQQAVKYMDEGMRRRIFRLINADLLDDGRGRLGIFPAADDATTVTLNSLPLVEKGMVVDVMDASNDDTKLADSVTVTAVNPYTREVTLSGAPAGTAAGDYIVIEDTTDDSLNDALHLNGVLGVVDDANPAGVVGNFGNINRSTAGNEFWQSIVLSNSGTNRPLTEDLLLQALDAAREKGGGKINAWLSNLAIARRYHEILAADRFYAYSKPGTIGGGIGRDEGSQKMGSDNKGKTVYEFSGIPWHVDPYFHANTVLGLDTSSLFIGTGENEVPRPISEIFEDQPFFKDTSNMTFEVVWYWQADLISDNPAANVKIEDVAES